MKITTAEDDFVIEKMIMKASMDIENFTGRKLRGRTYGSGGLAAELLDGMGTPRLFTGQYPISSVSSIHDDPEQNWSSDTLKASTDYTIFPDEGVIQLNTDALKGTIFSKGRANIRLIYTAGYDEFQVIDGYNDRLDFEETDSTELTAEIVEGVYTVATLMAALKTALEAVGDSVYTITYDYFTGKFKITSDRAGGGGTFEILWNTGTNKYRSIARLLGFQDDADDVDAASQEADDSSLGIPSDLEGACFELTLRKFKDGFIGSKRFDIKSKQQSGEYGGTTEYVGGAMPPSVAEVLEPYVRHMV